LTPEHAGAGTTMRGDDLSDLWMELNAVRRAGLRD